MALIAFADQVSGFNSNSFIEVLKFVRLKKIIILCDSQDPLVLPSYEEALRDGMGSSRSVILLVFVHPDL